MSDSIDYMSIKLLLFTHKKDWVQWSELFLARAKRKGYKHLLVDKDVKIPKASDPAPISEEDKKISDLNEDAYGDLISAMDLKKEGGKVAFNVIKGTKNQEYPNGNVQAAWKALEDKYNPKTAPSLSKVHKEFYGAKLKRNKDPDVWITYLEDLRTQLADMVAPVDDRQFIIQIMNNLPKDYQTMVLIIEQKMGKTNGGETLTLEELRGALSLNFREPSFGWW